MSFLLMDSFNYKILFLASAHRSFIIHLSLEKENDEEEIEVIKANMKSSLILKMTPFDRLTTVLSKNRRFISV